MQITKPTLLLDENKCRDNIQFMSSKATKHNLIFRPHFKTHQSLEIGRWFKETGTDKITVSSIEMAEYFSKEWNDITVAFPVNILEIESINKLASKIHINLLVESVESADYLKNNLKFKTGFFIKVDLGSHRTGLHPSDTNTIDKILEVSDTSELLTFKGFLGHSGHTYHCRSKDEINVIQNESMNIMKEFKNKYIGRYDKLIISTGDTPGCSISEKFSGTDEIRPGNFIFYDLMQLEIGSCSEDRIAIALACPVVAIHKDRNEIVIYGGGIHFSKENMHDKKNGMIFGRVVKNSGNGWGRIVWGMYVKHLSQEHGIVSVPDNLISNYRVGDILTILPVHSCMTADLMKNYLTLDGHRITMMNN
ncbi:MAG: alanine racemase [Ignavibacteria bacterium]